MIIQLKKSNWRKMMVCIAGAAMVLTMAGCGTAGKTHLFNGEDLSGWKIYMEDQSVDPADVWSVKDGVMRCEGMPFGYIRTTAKYSNYRLRVEWRWPDEPSNSGVFVHMDGPDQEWPTSIECQLMAGNAGDFIFFNDATSKESDGQFVLAKQNESSEKPTGEWNEYEIVCSGNTIVVFVNGVMQNEITESNISSGSICLQSEGLPIEFRNVVIEPL